MSSDPPLLVVFGSDEFRRERFLRSVVSKHIRDGWSSHDVDASDGESFVGNLLATTGVLFSQSALCLLRKPEKSSTGLVGLLQEHARDKDPMVVVVLVYEADKPSGPLWDMVPKNFHKGFTLPPFYKMEEAAVSFVLEESRGFKMEPTLAQALVRKVGLDFGVLAFEVSKATMLARALGTLALTPDIVKQSMAPLAETDGSSIIEALSARSTLRLAREMDTYRRSKGVDPTIEFCGRVLSPTVLRWLQACHLHASGVGPQAASARVGSNPWYWENKILPQARVWGVHGCSKLLSVVAKSQEAVFSGFLNPWGLLEAGLLRQIEDFTG